MASITSERNSRIIPLEVVNPPVHVIETGVHVVEAGVGLGRQATRPA
ncbi:MAG: hypothetical protein OXH69_25010 [Acidobacteria bacterium]|nr:hypothetical protein [Acidobacteriota bacterium]